MITDDQLPIREFQHFRLDFGHLRHHAQPTFGGCRDIRLLGTGQWADILDVQVRLVVEHFRTLRQCAVAVHNIKCTAQQRIQEVGHQATQGGAKQSLHQFIAHLDFGGRHGRGVFQLELVHIECPVYGVFQLLALELRHVETGARLVRLNAPLDIAHHSHAARSQVEV